MNKNCIRAALLAMVATSLPIATWAQPAPQPQRMQPWPEPQPQAPVQAKPSATKPRAAKSTANPGAAKSAPRARTVSCSGPFAKDSSHAKLGLAFGADNIEFTEVEGSDGSKLMASVIFPKDPKRRLEVVWQNEASRSDTALVVITGQSRWTAPKGLRLGLTLAALEKINGKPFRLAGLDQENGGSVTDWQGGALATLPGDCLVGVRLSPDPKTPEAARTAASGKEFTSNDAAIRALRPTVVEIILGYPQ